MRWLAPHSVFGFAGRLILLVGIVASANMGFAVFVSGYDPDDARYHLAHAFIVGGPLIAFFLAVTVFQIRLQRKLWRLSRKDGLTGLNNRRTFFDLARSAPAGRDQMVLLLLDADWFKSINDTYGHQAGDACLKSIAYTLRRNVREGDIIGRIGGEEFAVLLRNTTSNQARAIGWRLTKPIPFRFDPYEHLTVTLSIGATRMASGSALDLAISQADTALYQAKLDGKAQLKFFEHVDEDGSQTSPDQPDSTIRQARLAG